ncbi:MAG: type II secretion system protein [bacterium]
MKKGFSLIELVVVIGITSILVISITSIAMTSLLNTARIRNLIHSRESGNSAINQLQTSIRNSRTITVCNSANNILTISNPDGNLTTYQTETIDTTTRLASNSGQYLTPADTTLTGFDINCFPTDQAPNLVQIKFTITNTSSGGKAAETPSIPYETSIQIRN